MSLASGNNWEYQYSIITIMQNFLTFFILIRIIQIQEFTIKQFIFDLICPYLQSKTRKMQYR